MRVQTSLVFVFVCLVEFSIPFGNKHSLYYLKQIYNMNHTGSTHYSIKTKLNQSRHLHLPDSDSKFCMHYSLFQMRIHYEKNPFFIFWAYILLPNQFLIAVDNYSVTIMISFFSYFYPFYN